MTHKFANRHAKPLTESSRQINGMNIDFSRDLREREAFGKVFKNHFSSLPEPCRHIPNFGTGPAHGLSEEFERDTFDRQFRRGVRPVKLAIEPRHQARHCPTAE